MKPSRRMVSDLVPVQSATRMKRTGCFAFPMTKWSRGRRPLYGEHARMGLTSHRAAGGLRNPLPGRCSRDRGSQAAARESARIILQQDGAGTRRKTSTDLLRPTRPLLPRGPKLPKPSNFTIYAAAGRPATAPMTVSTNCAASPHVRSNSALTASLGAARVTVVMLKRADAESRPTQSSWRRIETA